MRLFLDANILFTAAHNPDGKAAFLIQESKTVGWQLVTCKLAAEEARRNLELKYPEALQPLTKILVKIEIAVTTVTGNCPISLPPKDMPIFLTAIQTRCTHLLTGDLKHFGKYMNQSRKCGDLLIQTVSEFLNSFLTAK